MPYCVKTGQSINGGEQGDIRLTQNGQRVMVSDWSSDDARNPNRDHVHGWPLDPFDDSKGEYQRYHMSTLGISWTKHVVTTAKYRPYGRRDVQLDMDKAYDQMVRAANEYRYRADQLERDFDDRVKLAALELVHGSVAQARPEARATRL